MNFNAKNDGDGVSVAGVYQSDDWNGKTGTLILYPDGTCQHPSGSKGTWVLEDNVVRMVVVSYYSGVSSEGAIQDVTKTNNYEAKIMEEGLVLHSHFFKKVSG